MGEIKVLAIMSDYKEFEGMKPLAATETNPMGQSEETDEDQAW